jgi:hypothetical protein
LQLLGGCEIDELGGLGGGGGERLFDEDVFTVFEGGFGELEVSPDGGDDGDGVDVGRMEELGGVADDQYAGMSFAGAFLGDGIGVANGSQLTAVCGLKVPGDDGPPVTIPDNADSNHDSSGKKEDNGRG